MLACKLTAVQISLPDYDAKPFQSAPQGCAVCGHQFSGARFHISGCQALPPNRALAATAPATNPQRVYAIDAGNLPADIKVHCIGAGDIRRKVVQVTQSINGVRYRSFYDEHWDRQDFVMAKIPRIPYAVPKPESLDQILSIAEILAGDFSYVRVDMYEVKGKFYFGELTFTPSAGFYSFVPDSVDYQFGELVRTGSGCA